MPILPWIAASAVLLGLAGYGAEKIAERRLFQRYPPPGRLIDVDGHRLHLSAMGERRAGQPTVVLEAGLGTWSFGWNAVQPQVTAFARVVAYDRAGYGWSDPAPQPRTLQQMADELHVLLVRAGEPGPYVLVAHSLGGATVRLYAARYPDEVAGMVLVDPVHERFLEGTTASMRQINGVRAYYAVVGALASLGIIRLLSHTPFFPKTGIARTPQDLAMYRAFLSLPTFHRTLLAETDVSFGSAAQVIRQLREAGDLGSRPLVVIQPAYPEDETHRFNDTARANIRMMQDGLDRVAALSTRGRLVVAEKSWHNTPGDQPEVIVEAIREVVDACTQK